jgi:transposase-like protein
LAIEQILEGLYCPICIQPSKFKYIGMRLKDKDIEYYYNCPQCENTFNERTIIDFTDFFMKKYYPKEKG